MIDKVNWLEYLDQLDSQIGFKNAFGDRLVSFMSKLIYSFKEDGALPYVIGENARYRSSPLATTLLNLHTAGLLTSQVKETLQEKILFYKDHVEPDDPRRQVPYELRDEDVGAWDVGEGASVWTTAMAIWALCETNYKNVNCSQITEALHWLIKQQEESGAWKYQMHNNCKESIPVTCIATRALMATLNVSLEIAFNIELEKAISKSRNYLKKSMQSKGKFFYWTFHNQPSICSTVWATRTLYDLHAIEPNHKEAIVRFCMSKMPASPDIWKSEKFVIEGGAKYQAQKNFFCFMPSLIPDLLYLGANPFDTKILNQIIWLVQNREECWRINGYNTKSPCTFSHAMALSVLLQWFKYVDSALVTRLLKKPADKALYHLSTTNNINYLPKDYLFYKIITPVLASCLGIVLLFPKLATKIDSFIQHPILAGLIVFVIGPPIFNWIKSVNFRTF